VVLALLLTGLHQRAYLDSRGSDEARHADDSEDDMALGEVMLSDSENNHESKADAQTQ
jgi:hypothetical protein